MSESRVYKKICAICERKDKYMTGTRTRERLSPCEQLRSDDTLRNVAIEKQDSRLIALLTRELFAAEGWYHRSCYRSYTRKSPPAPMTCADQYDEYDEIQTSAYEKLFSYIRDTFENPQILRLTQLTTKLTTWMMEDGIHDVKDSTKKHVRRNLESEFGESLLFVQDSKGKVLVYPDGLSRDELVRQNVDLMNEVEKLKGKLDSDDLIKHVAHIFNSALSSHETSTSWPIISELKNTSHFIPNILTTFLQNLVARTQNVMNISPRVQCLIESVGQDIVYGVSR